MKILLVNLTLALALIFWSCSDPEVAGGTASEGETYVYGQVADSAGAAISQAKVYLTKVIITSEGSDNEVVDSTTTDDSGQYEFYPDTSVNTSFVVQIGDFDEIDSGVAGMASSLQWPPPTAGAFKVDEVRLGPPILVRGRVANLKVCSASEIPPKIFIPGTPFFKTLTPTGEFQLPPSPIGRFEIGVICSDAVQIIPIHIPPGCLSIVLPEILLHPPEAYADNKYSPYPTDLDHSIRMPNPEGGLGNTCLEGQIGHP